MDWLITAFDLEVVSEEEDGYVIVASSDEQLSQFTRLIQEFARGVRGSTSTAKIYAIETNDDRLHRILQDELFAHWPHIQDKHNYVVDIGIECRGVERYSKRPQRELAESDENFQQRIKDYHSKYPDRDLIKYLKKNPQRQLEDEASFAKRERAWLEKVAEIESTWDDLQDRRLTELGRFVSAGGGTVGAQREGPGREEHMRLPDSLEVRVTLPGRLLKDLVMNYPFVFDVSLPPELESHMPGYESGLVGMPRFQPLAPEPDAPTVGVIDSGVQEGHRLLAPAIRGDLSVSFVPGQITEFSDRVGGGGHGTRVAGAVLYGDCIPIGGSSQLPFWIRNIRVLDEQCRMSDRLPPARYLRTVASSSTERIYNHSINGSRPCRLKHMSAWAATIDLLSYEHDILFVQPTGNIDVVTHKLQNPGILEHLAAGRTYPDYLLQPASRIATPAESLSALCVGSVAFRPTHPHYFGENGSPSSFTRTGLGIWDSLKPDVVEYGGDWVHDGCSPPALYYHRDSCPDLVRSTLYPPSPAHDRDQVGTSFAAPKVARLAATLQRLLPGEPCLLYRALIAQSARWPAGAPTSLETLRQIGYGLPDEARATLNSPYRITLITSGTQQLVGGDAHIFQVPVPPNMRRPEMIHRVRLEVTLSYAARPRRTRRTLSRYLSTWLSWDVSKGGESFESFRDRVLKDGEDTETDGEGIFPWVLRDRKDWGEIDDASRNRTTLQKDWCTVPAYRLPVSFCVAVIGHKGWAENDENAAKYALAISFEMINRDLEIYELVRAEVESISTPIQIRLQV